MKIGIVTINDIRPNYGNRLQNYAVDYVLQKRGCITETLYVERKKGIKKTVKDLIHSVTFYRLSKNPAARRCAVKKRRKFDRFNRRYLRMRHVESFDGLSEQYDYFVVGSDQVWNPSWYNDKKKEAYLLTFADREQKICFSPSFGIAELPPEWKEHFRTHLNRFGDISVRENEGAAIVKELTGKEAEVLIDPTLMLGKEEWLRIADTVKSVGEEDYILTYFLGDRGTEVNEVIEQLNGEKHMKVYHLLDMDNPDLFTADPSQFIGLFSNASLILTDSFHACVFSFIFDKPFCVFRRQGKEKDMMSRMNTLLSKFCLERKLYHEGMDMFECDYHAGKQILLEEQKKVEQFLDKYLQKGENV